MIMMSTHGQAVMTESANAALSDPTLAACSSCDLVQRLPEITLAQIARCPRCATELRRGHKDSLNRTLALTAAAAILYIIAQTAPMLGLTAAGYQSFTTVVGGAVKLWKNGEEAVAGLVFLAAVLMPALQISLLLVVSIGARCKRPPAWIGSLLRHRAFTSKWSMIEVMMLGVLVALTKIAEYATVIPGDAIFALGGLIVLLAAIHSTFDPYEVWKCVEWNSAPGKSLAVHLSAQPMTAMQQGLQRCEHCEMLSRPLPGQEEGRCPRCGAELTFRKKDSLRRTVAFLIAAAICYIPANLLPVMTTYTVTSGAESDTIMQGVVLLWSSTGWPLSLIVLFASIMIPSAKIISLLHLVISVKRGSIQNPGQRVRLYRLVDVIGRWSMVDIFVDTFTVALIQLQPLMYVRPARGIFFFSAVVILTMLAVQSFDPRLIWDPTSSKEVRYA
jgi:paraquat-inducible protein A